MLNFRILAAALMAALAAGCVTPSRVAVPPPLDLPPRAAPPADAEILEGAPNDRTLRQVGTPVVPGGAPQVANRDTAVAMPPLSGPPISASLEGLPLPSFVNEAFGSLLKLNFQIDPSLAKRNDLVTLRLSSPQSPEAFYQVATQVLRAYGVAVTWDGSVVQVVPAAQADAAEPPLIISGRALPDVPMTHRPVFQLVEMRSVRASSVSKWLRTAFPQTSELSIEDDAQRNAVILYGKPAMVRQAVSAIAVLDQPFMRGRQSTRIEPAFVSAQELATRLVEVLLAEGYAAATQLGEGTGTLVLPVAGANMVLVFTTDAATLNHVVEWARTIDQPNQASGGDGMYYYQVKNTEAKSLFATLRGVTGIGSGGGGDNNSREAPPLAGDTRPAATAAAVTEVPGGRLALDEPRNAIIFQGAAPDWMRLMTLIQKMDRAARQVMIEVTIAEVSLNDNESFGMAWFARGNLGRFNEGMNFGTFPGDGTANPDDGSAGGLTYLLNVAGENRLALTAFANDSRVSILSTPRLLVKSGETASIDVGTEVPTLTTQTTSDQQQNGDTALLQGIQYRKTGILLTIEPTVYSDNRVDLVISQEVSDALQVEDDAVVASPSIFNRKVATSLSLRDGGSVLLGGLMSQRETNGDSGIPGLKDVPVLGYLFKNKSKRNTKTELVLIIRPYIIENDDDAQSVSEAITDRLEFIDMPEDTYTAPATSYPALPSESLPVPSGN